MLAAGWISCRIMRRRIIIITAPLVTLDSSMGLYYAAFISPAPLDDDGTQHPPPCLIQMIYRRVS